MARPLSEEKRQAILDAATNLIAEQGLSVSTAKIAKLANVSEGTIFTYFQNKDELINQLYLSLKQQLRSALILPEQSVELREQVQGAWRAYISWGLSNPHGQQVLATLSLSSIVTDTTRAIGNDAFCDISIVLKNAMAEGALSHQSPDYVGAIMVTMANTTMEFMKLDAINAEALLRDGFAAFWRVIAYQ